MSTATGTVVNVDNQQSDIDELWRQGLQAMTDALGMSAFVLDRQYRYLAFNSAHATRMAALYGARIELNHSFYEYQTVPGDARKSFASLNRALAGEKFVLRAYSGDQTARHFLEIAHAPIRDHHGNVLAVSVFSSDLTELERAEEALKLGEARFERERLELELRYAQKLETVGRLAAGIAHEINTPVQYAIDNVCFIRAAIENLMRLIPKYREAISMLGEVPARDRVLQDLQDAEEDADLEFISANLDPAFDQCLDGMLKVSKIVTSMKEFAHPDDSEKTATDLNQAIHNVIAICQNEYKGIADLELDLGELPPVLCHVGHLKQVLFNLIVNAAYAIADAVGNTGKLGKIRITTRHEDNVVCVLIADNGVGIPNEIRERIFDPFFTTKPIGKGSGEGLAIARAIIVDKHCGLLTFESRVGKGSTFCVQLPVDGRTPVSPRRRRYGTPDRDEEQR